ncbi:hypothetical protein MP638_007116 [Amoeboaphelidium occidentale]|nr:hypothetical protein MP638_007116 [Amoeboaphelidium occidentale]
MVNRFEANGIREAPVLENFIGEFWALSTETEQETITSQQSTPAGPVGPSPQPQTTKSRRASSIPLEQYLSFPPSTSTVSFSSAASFGPPQVLPSWLDTPLMTDQLSTSPSSSSSSSPRPGRRRYKYPTGSNYN